MKNLTHTPAPWKIGVRQPSSDKFIYGPRGEEIADCDRLFNTPQENLGNARLIAAAPELLTALRRVYSDWQTLVGEDLKEQCVDVAEIWNECADAIAKATGEE